MMEAQPKREYCNHGCCNFIDGKEVSKAEYEKADPVAMSHRKMPDRLIPCRKPCIECGHSEQEHMADGCHHLGALPPQPHGNPEKLVCGCQQFRRPLSPPR